MKTSQQKIFLVVLLSIIITLAVASQIALAHQQTENQFYLVSLGVGDSDLITLRAIETIKVSDIIVCRDRTKAEFSEYLQGKTILDPSRVGWRMYRKDCDAIDDLQERTKCQRCADDRTQLIKQIRLVIFTMHTKFNELVDKLKTHYPASTPIAIVFYAGYKQKEHIVRGRLDTIIAQTKDKSFPFEHLVYVGDFME